MGVKSFFETFDIEIPKLPRTGKAKTLEKNKEIPNKDDLLQVLKVADPLEKAILLTGVSSGLAANEICNLKVGEFKKGYDPETGITTLPLWREKVEFDFITFLSPEASQAIWDYLDYRSRTTDTNETRRKYGLQKQKVHSDNNYFFICRQIPAEFLETRDENLRKLDTLGLAKVHRRLAEKARKGTPCGDWGFIRSHNIRKYFNSALLTAGADSFFVEFTMGHTLNETRRAYFRASPEKLKEIYLKFVPYITIQKEADISERPEYLRIKQENQILQAETTRHIVERSELQELRARTESQEKQLKILVEKTEMFMESTKKRVETEKEMEKALEKEISKKLLKKGIK